VPDRFQDGRRRRHVGNSSECYQMGNYHPILIKIGTQTKKNMLSSKITKAEVCGHFQDGRRCYLGNSSACYKMGNNRAMLMKSGTQTKTDMLSLKITKAEVYGKNKQQKLNVKNDIVVKRQRCMSAKLAKSKNFLFAGRSLHTHTTGG
jgi:hypothetical protein